MSKNIYQFIFERIYSLQLRKMRIYFDLNILKDIETIIKFKIFRPVTEFRVLKMRIFLIKRFKVNIFRAKLILTSQEQS